MKLLCIVGPTAVGKTELALYLAKKFEGELIACDSRQIYKSLKIGAGKGEEKVWLYDLVPPDIQYSVAKFAKDARAAIENITKRKKLPILVGGSGLYLKGLLGGIPSIQIPPNKKLRAKLEKLSLQELKMKLIELSLNEWKKINDSDRYNKRRLIRRLEIMSSSRKKVDKAGSRWNTLKIGLSAPREVLYKRIDQRVLSRLDQGMVNEATSLYKEGLSIKRMKELGMEYGILADYLEGNINYHELVSRLQSRIHQYAKRQITWFKKDSETFWFDITKDKWRRRVALKVSAWYNSPSDP